MKDLLKRVSTTTECIKYGFCNIFFINNIHHMYYSEGEDSTITYRQLSEKLELLCRFFSIAFIATHQFVMLTVFLYTVINYYILDTGDESFVLFYPATYVS